MDIRINTFRVARYGVCLPSCLPACQPACLPACLSNKCHNTFGFHSMQRLFYFIFFILPARIFIHSGKLFIFFFLSFFLFFFFFLSFCTIPIPLVLLLFLLFLRVFKTCTYIENLCAFVSRPFRSYADFYLYEIICIYRINNNHTFPKC